jgi:hypothetical protein
VSSANRECHPRKAGVSGRLTRSGSSPARSDGYGCAILPGLFLLDRVPSGHEALTGGRYPARCTRYREALTDTAALNQSVWARPGKFWVLPEAANAISSRRENGPLGNTTMDNDLLSHFVAASGASWKPSVHLENAGNHQLESRNLGIVSHRGADRL